MKSKKNNQNNELIVGAVIGGIVGIGAAVLLSPKKHKNLGQELYSTYCDLTEKASHIKEDVVDQFDDIKDIAQEWSKHASHDNAILVGGGILGILISLFLAQKFIKGSSNAKFFDQAEGWIKKAKVMLDIVNKEMVSGAKEFAKHSHNSWNLADVLDLTKRGLHIYNELIQRR